MPQDLLQAWLGGYPDALVAQVSDMLSGGQLGPHLLRKYPQPHAIRTDAALYDYVQHLRSTHLRSASPVHKVLYDSQLRDLRRALGTHTRSSRVQGSQLRAKREIRIAGLFRCGPEEFLRMIVAHELAHLRVSAHDKAFYQLCRHIAPDYEQLEFDLRLYLCHLAAGGAALWRGEISPSAPAA